MIMNWIPITRYSGFYDVPRLFFIDYRGKHLFFECNFDEAADDYESSFRVYLMPKLSEAEIIANGTRLASLAQRMIGRIPIAQVQFDSTRRKAIAEESLKGLPLEVVHSASKTTPAEGQKEG
jgi:hypothetical protein